MRHQRLPRLQCLRPLDRLRPAAGRGRGRQNFADYRLDNVANAIYDFVWNEFCDWYLEIAKVQINTGTPEQQRHPPHADPHSGNSAAPGAPDHPLHHRGTVAKVAPVAGRAGDSVSIAAYPVAAPERIDAAAEGHVAKLKAMVDACRNLRGEMNVSPAQRLPLFAVGDAEFVQSIAPVLQSLAKLQRGQGVRRRTSWTEAAQATLRWPWSARHALCLFMEIDIAAEKARLSKEAARLSGEIAKGQRQARQRGLRRQGAAAVIEQEKSAWPTLARRWPNRAATQAPGVIAAAAMLSPGGLSGRPS